MTTQAVLGTDLAAPAFLPARHQTTVPEDQLINSATAGVMVHRSAQIKYDFRQDALSFSTDLLDHMNRAQAGYITTFLYEELFGRRNHFHWLVHMKQPSDYARLLDMVEHDDRWKEISVADRLPKKGGGNWEKMFVEESISEHVMTPQHGFTHADDDHDDVASFQPPARHQTGQAPDQILHSANAPLTVHRTVRASYEMRQEAREFLADWAGHVNTRFAGRITVLQFEETWGAQDRLHMLVHLASLDDYAALCELEDSDRDFRAVFAAQRVPNYKGGGNWGRTFREGTLKDTLWVPRHGVTASE